MDPLAAKRIIPSSGSENIPLAKKPAEDEPEPQIIVEEKIVDKNGERVKKYLRGKFLGKVI